MNTIVLGENHYNTLGLVRSLGEGDHKVFLILKRSHSNFVNKSKYIEQTFCIDNQDEILTAILKIYNKCNDKPALFVASEEFADYVNEFYDTLSKYCNCEGGGKSNSLNSIRSKDAMNSLALRCGLVIPQTSILEYEQSIPINLKYPVIVKSSVSVIDWKKAMKKCENFEDLKSHISSLKKDYFPILIQQFIKKDHEMMILGCSINGGETVLCPVGHKKIRYYPNEYGLGSYSKSFLTDSDICVRPLVEKIKIFLSHINYSGLFSAEFVHIDNQYYFLEVNLRNDATSIMSTRCGFNLPDIMCRYYSFGKIKINELTAYKERYYMNIIADLYNVKSGNISFAKWIKQLCGAGAYAYFDGKDPIPFIFYMYKILKFKINRILTINSNS